MWSFELILEKRMDIERARALTIFYYSTASLYSRLKKRMFLKTFREVKDKWCKNVSLRMDDINHARYDSQMQIRYIQVC